MPQTFQMRLPPKFSLQTLRRETKTTPRFKHQNLNFLNVRLLHKTPSYYSTQSTFFSSGKGLPLRKCSTNNGDSIAKEEDEDDDERALQAVLKLNNAIKNKNICELSEIFGDDSRCWCNFIPFFHSFRGKQQVMVLFSYLIKCLGKNIEFVFQPVSNEGMTVGVTWKLEWNKATIVPLGKGFSFHICHAYQGKIVIRNVEVFMEPMIHFEPFRLKMGDLMMALKKKAGCLTKTTAESKVIKRAAFFGLLALLFIVAASFFFFPKLRS